MGLFSWLAGDESGGALYKREPVKQTSKRIKIEDDRVFELNIVGYLSRAENG